MFEQISTASFVEVVSPVDGSVVGCVSETSAERVAERACELRDRQADWQHVGLGERARWLGLFRDWMLDNEKRLTNLILAESGKVHNDAALEVPLAADIINFMCSEGRAALRTANPRPHGPLAASKKLSTVLRPYPLVGVISPWNFPLVLPMLDAVPALVAGAAVLIKPSEVAPLAIDELSKGWQEIGAPDVLACVGGRAATGTAIVENVDYIQFTGSTNTGRKVAQHAAERLIPFGLELGGKDPMLVLADADLERAVNGAAWGGLFNAGQACVSVERIYVEGPVYDEFVDRLTSKVTRLRSGGGTHSDVGAMANETQLEIVERHVADAVDRGARITTGGTRTGSGLHFAPTVVANADHSMKCMQEETFGPVLPVMSVESTREAVRYANDSPYGLSASVWTAGIECGLSVADGLDAGGVNVNDVLMNVFSFRLPHGGWKYSGIGARSGGVAAIRKYCRSQARTSPRVSPRNELLWFPYSATKSRLITRAFRSIVGRGRRRLFR